MNKRYRIKEIEGKFIIEVSVKKITGILWFKREFDIWIDLNENSSTSKLVTTGYKHYKSIKPFNSLAEAKQYLDNLFNNVKKESIVIYHPYN